MRILFKVILLTALAVTTSYGAVDPYTSDANTLHLWHLDETSGALADSAGSLTLYNWSQKAHMPLIQLKA